MRHSSNDLYDHLVADDLQQNAAFPASFAYRTAMSRDPVSRLSSGRK